MEFGAEARRRLRRSGGGAAPPEESNPNPSATDEAGERDGEIVDASDLAGVEGSIGGAEGGGGGSNGLGASFCDLSNGIGRGLGFCEGGRGSDQKRGRGGRGFGKKRAGRRARFPRKWGLGVVACSGVSRRCFERRGAVADSVRGRHVDGVIRFALRCVCSAGW